MKYLILHYVDKKNTKQSKTFILYKNLKWNSNFEKNKIYINIKKIFNCK